MTLSHRLRTTGKIITYDSPTVISSTGTLGSGVTPVNAALPSGIVAGDLLVMFIAAGTASGAVITTPTGWTQVAVQTAGNRSGAYYKIATGTEGATQAVTLSTNSDTSSFNVLLIRGATGINVSGAFSANDATSPLTNTGITPTATGLLLGFWSIRSGGTTPVSVTAGPSGMALERIVSGYYGNAAITNAVYWQNWGATVTGTREITTTAGIDTSRSLLVQIR